MEEAEHKPVGIAVLAALSVGVLREWGFRVRKRVDIGEKAVYSITNNNQGLGFFALTAYNVAIHRTEEGGQTWQFL